MIRILVEWEDVGDSTGQTIKIDAVDNETEPEIINAAIALTALTEVFHDPLEGFMKDHYEDKVVSAGKRIALAGLMKRLGGEGGQSINKDSLKKMLMGKEIPPEAVLTLLMSGGGGLGSVKEDDPEQNETPKKEVRNKRKTFNQFKGDNL